MTPKWRTLFVTEPGSSVSVTSGRIKVVRGDDVVADCPLLPCRSLTVFGGVEVARSALDALARNRACVHVVSWAGEPVGTFWPAKETGAGMRVAQAVYCSSLERREALAHWIVRQKVLSHRHSLAQRTWSRPVPEVGDAVARLDRLLAEGLASGSGGTLRRLRAVEARAARWNFEALNALLPEEFRFEARTRRPPRDPFNALLSLGYTMATNEMLRMIRAKGLDPYIGFLHETQRNNPALASDLVEPFRSPLVERWALNLVRLRMVSLGDFETDERGGVRFADRADLRRAIQRFQRAMGSPLPVELGAPYATCEKAMAALVDALRRSFRDGVEPDWSLG